MPTLDKRVEDLVIGILAGLAAQGHDTLRMSDRKVHEQFTRVLEKLKQSGGELAELANQFYKNVITDTYDELDHSLITAEQFGFVKFPNPSYSRLTIAITPRMAHRLLSKWSADQRTAIQDAARELKNGP